MQRAKPAHTWWLRGWGGNASQSQRWLRRQLGAQEARVCVGTCCPLAGRCAPPRGVTMSIQGSAAPVTGCAAQGCGPLEPADCTGRGETSPADAHGSASSCCFCCPMPDASCSKPSECASSPQSAVVGAFCNAASPRQLVTRNLSCMDANSVRGGTVPMS